LRQKGVCSGSRPGWGQTPANFVWQNAKSPPTSTNPANETGRHGGDLVVFDCFPPQHPRGPSLSPSTPPLLPRRRRRPHPTALPTPLGPKDNTHVVVASIRHL